MIGNIIGRVIARKETSASRQMAEEVQYMQCAASKERVSHMRPLIGRRASGPASRGPSSVVRILMDDHRRPCSIRKRYLSRSEGYACGDVRSALQDKTQGTGEDWRHSLVMGVRSCLMAFRVMRSWRSVVKTFAAPGSGWRGGTHAPINGGNYSPMLR